MSCNPTPQRSDRPTVRKIRRTVKRIALLEWVFIQEIKYPRFYAWVYAQSRIKFRNYVGELDTDDDHFLEDDDDSRDADIESEENMTNSDGGMAKRRKRHELCVVCLQNPKKGCLETCGSLSHIEICRASSVAGNVPLSMWTGKAIEVGSRRIYDPKDSYENQQAQETWARLVKSQARERVIEQCSRMAEDGYTPKQVLLTEAWNLFLEDLEDQRPKTLTGLNACLSSFIREYREKLISCQLLQETMQLIKNLHKLKVISDDELNDYEISLSRNGVFIRSAVLRR